MGTALQALQLIDEVLAAGGVDGKNLWGILTALRGPDNGNNEMKERTTCVIRRLALPRTTSAAQGTTPWPNGYRNGAYFGSPRVVETVPKLDWFSDDEHFQTHICHATHALRDLGLLA